jgi:cathepsin L
LKYGDENALKRAVATIGPVAIGVDASEWQFASYSTGIYSSTKCDANNVNHVSILPFNFCLNCFYLFFYSLLLRLLL